MNLNNYGFYKIVYKFIVYLKRKGYKLTHVKYIEKRW